MATPHDSPRPANARAFLPRFAATARACPEPATKLALDVIAAGIDHMDDPGGMGQQAALCVAVGEAMLRLTRGGHLGDEIERVEKRVAELSVADVATIADAIGPEAA